MADVCFLKSEVVIRQSWSRGLSYLIEIWCWDRLVHCWTSAVTKTEAGCGFPTPIWPQFLKFQKSIWR